MTTVTVHASRTYEVPIGRGLLAELGARTAAVVCGRTAAIVSDTNVAPLYLAQAEASLRAAGFATSSFVFPAGEGSKNGRTYLALLEDLAQRHLTRADCLVALGGGVVGDLTGFAAATYLRGTAFVQVPTTLLAAVDASVGGKTAIDLAHGKNLAGAFCQPRLVLCDLDTLATLPPADFADGCAEVIKYGMIGDAALLDLLERADLRDEAETVVARCVAHKRDLVEQDEFDTGARQLLNLGHTFGHGVEACSGYAVSHGRAVSIGMMMAARAAVAAGLCPADVPPRLGALLTRHGLPTTTDYTADALREPLLSDKKRAGDTLTLVLPRAWGRSELCPVPVDQMALWIERGLSQ